MSSTSSQDETVSDLRAQAEIGACERSQCESNYKTMATIVPIPADYPDEIVGYVEPWIASPGEEIAVKVCVPLN